MSAFHLHSGLLKFKYFGYSVLLSVVLCKLYFTVQLIPPSPPPIDNYEYSEQDSQEIWRKMNTSYYVAMGCNDNLDYLFPLFITIKRWNVVGVKAVVCFSESEEVMHNSEQKKFIMDKIKTTDTQIIYVNSTLIPSHTITQMCRLFVSNSPDVNISDDSVVITSDTDFWPIQMRYHLVPSHLDIFLFHYFCCGFTRRPWGFRWFRHHRLATIAMRASVWRQLFGDDKFMTDGDALSRRILEEFPPKYIIHGRPKPYITKSWFADQILISDKISDYKLIRPDRVGGIPIQASESMTRDSWPTVGSGFHLEAYKELHLVNPLQSPENWNLVLPVMQRLLPPDALSEVVEYYNELHSSL